MTVREFELRLRSHLRQVDPQEVEEAVAYYREIFQDMKLGALDNVPEEYRDVRRIALEIRRDSVLTELEYEPEKKETKEWKIFFLTLLALPVGIPLFIVIITLAVAVISTLGSFIVAAVVVAGAILVSLFTQGVNGIWQTVGLLGIFFIALSVIFVIVGLVGLLKNYVMRKLQHRKKEEL